MKGLCAGLGEEKGFALGDLGDGTVKGVGMTKFGLSPPFAPSLGVLEVLKLKALEGLSPAVASAKGLIFAYAEKPVPLGNDNHGQCVKEG